MAVGEPVDKKDVLVLAIVVWFLLFYMACDLDDRHEDAEARIEALETNQIDLACANVATADLCRQLRTESR